MQPPHEKGFTLLHASVVPFPEQNWSVGGLGAVVEQTNSLGSTMVPAGRVTLVSQTSANQVEESLLSASQRSISSSFKEDTGDSQKVGRSGSEVLVGSVVRNRVDRFSKPISAVAEHRVDTGTAGSPASVRSGSLLGEQFHLRSASTVSNSSNPQPKSRATSIVVGGQTDRHKSQVFQEPVAGSYTYTQLKGSGNRPEEVDPTRKEKYLSVEEFVAVFGIDRHVFLALPKWKQAERKKGVDLY